jgi:two-component SAPR family response regulator
MKRTLWCTLIDDEDANNQLLRSMIEDDGRLTVERVFTSPNRLLEELPNLRSSIFFLDVQMQDMDGLQLSDSLKDKIVVFVSAYPNYAAQSYEKEALNYLVKPLNPEKLEKAIDGIIKKAQSIERPWLVQTTKGQIKLNKQDIIKIVSDSTGDPRDKIIHLKNNAKDLVVKTRTMEDLLTELDCKEFLMVKKDTILNINAVIVKLPSQTIKIHARDNSTELLTVSDTFYKSFCQIFDFWATGYNK